MGFAGENDLKRAGAYGDFAQSIDIGKKQIGPLVGGGAPGEAQGQYLHVHGHPRLLFYRGEQRGFGYRVGFPNLAPGYTERVAQTEIILSPAGNVMIVELLKRL
jgi:hypothetical protein